MASIIFFNSGITDINRSTLKIRRRRKTKKLELFGIGMREIATIIVSKNFDTKVLDNKFLKMEYIKDE